MLPAIHAQTTVMEVRARTQPQELAGFTPHDLEPVRRSMRERAGGAGNKSDIKLLAKFQRAVIIIKDILLPNEEAKIAHKASHGGKNHNLLRQLFKSRAYEVIGCRGRGVSSLGAGEELAV